MISVVTTAVASAAATATAGTVSTGTIGSIVTSVVPSAIASALPSAITTTAPVTSTMLHLPVPFEVSAIFAGALTGAMVAVNRRLDLTGVLTLALASGLGGGILRDVLLQNQGIFALQTPRALLAVLIGVFIGAFFYRVAERLHVAVVVIDALSLSLFCLVGADKALVSGLNAYAAVLLGVMTAVGGGVLRDVLLGTVPQVMRRGSLYAVAAGVGSVAYVLMVVWLPIAKPIALAVAGLLAFTLRVGSLWLGWESPEPYDLTPAIAQVPGRVWQHGRRLLGRPIPPAAEELEQAIEDDSEEAL